MSGTTPNHALPYPEATDLQYLGAANIQQLAERVDTAFGASLVHLSELMGVDDSQAIPAGAEMVIAFPGGITTATTDWALSPDKKTVIYSGPPRWFMVSGRARYSHPGDPDINITTVIYKNGTAVARDQHRTAISGGGNVQPNWTAKPGPVPVHLVSGDQLNMRMTASDAGTVAWVGLTLVGMFGAEA